MKQRARSTRCTPLVALVAGAGITGCVRAPSTVAAVPLWVAPVCIGGLLLVAVGLRALFLIRRRRSSAGPGVTAQPTQAQPQPQPMRPFPLLPPPPPPRPVPVFAPLPFDDPAPLSPPEPVRHDPDFQAASPLLPPDPARAPTPAGPAPLAGWYPDPGGRHAARYWDGASWTRLTR